MKNYRLAAVIEKDEDGYFAFCPDLQGCYTSGDTFEEARANLADAVVLHIADRLAEGEEIRLPESINLTAVEVLGYGDESVLRFLKDCLCRD